MFNNLPLESKLDIFKHLNIEQLTSVRQTNYYFNALIGRYEGELARKKFDKIVINYSYSYKFINLQDGVFELKMTEKLMEKWKSALDRQIPVYLDNNENQKVIRFYEGPGYNSSFILNLPTIPKNIEEIKIIRCWMEKISYCYFNNLVFIFTHFNPELIQLIFEDEEKFKFKGKTFKCFEIINENVLLFYLNRLVISECFSVDFFLIDNTFNQQSINTLFNFLLKTPKLYFGNSKNSSLCKMILNYIETSKDNSNMVNYIKFTCYCWPTFNLSERAEFIRREQSFYGLIPSMFSHYQLSNIHNPKVKFSISYLECYELIYRFEIRRMS
ncbi:hypothetical protein ACQ4LE_006425 [Meloidogyne hapla]